MKQVIVHAILTLLLAGPLAAQPAQRVAWNRPAEPFHLLANLYYVGTEGLSAFLFTTPAGHILVDGALPESVPAIARNIERLGFRLGDVKILLNTHAHYDHAGGLAFLQKLTGARLIAHAADADTLARGRVDYGPSADTPFPPARVDERVGDGHRVTLGGTTLTLLHAPGHTRGCSCWQVTLVEAGQPYRVLLHGSTSVAGNPVAGCPAYPDIAADYERTFRRLDGVACDIFLAPHPGFCDLARKRARMRERAADGRPVGFRAFVDPGELARFNAQSRADFRRELTAAQRRAR